MHDLAGDRVPHKTLLVVVWRVSPLRAVRHSFNVQQGLMMSDFDLRVIWWKLTRGSALLIFLAQQGVRSLCCASAGDVQISLPSGDWMDSAQSSAATSKSCRLSIANSFSHQA